MNPLWYILVVNIIALFVVPFLTYRYSHKNNLKVLKEKWISELRNASSQYLEACEKLYYANDTRYSSLTGQGKGVDDSVRRELITRCQAEQANVTGAYIKMQLLFKDGDSNFVELQSAMDNLLSGVDKPEKINDSLAMDITNKHEAQNQYLREVNRLLHRFWNQITGES